MLSSGFEDDSKDPQLSDQVHKIGCAFDPPQFHNVNLKPVLSQPAGRRPLSCWAEGPHSRRRGTKAGVGNLEIDVIITYLHFYSSRRTR
jgi:hypothetical protein